MLDDKNDTIESLKLELENIQKDFDNKVELSEY